MTFVIKNAAGEVLLIADDPWDTDLAPAEAVHALRPYTDRGNRRRPGIKGTQAALDAEVQTILGTRMENRFIVAAGVIEAKVREAYRVEDAA